MSENILGGSGIVLASFGRSALVQTPLSALHCGFVGRGLRIICGDRVTWRRKKPHDEPLIESVESRINVLEKIDGRGRPTPLAANIDRLAVVLAPAPTPEWFVIDRYLAGAQLKDIGALLIVNKRDLGLEQIQSELQVYRKIKLDCLELSTRDAASLQSLRAAISGLSVMLVGQSGVGKSSIINALIPDAAAQTAALSRDAEGRHTTTTARRYQLNADSAIIDAPGVRDYAPPCTLERSAERGFSEIHAAAANCRFNDCRHYDEPSCAVREAVARADIAPRRYESYRRLLRLYEDFN